MVGQLNGRVLLVDDEPLFRKSISGSLVAAGYVVRVATDGLDAIAKLRVGLPDLIICDLEMPRMSGFELLDVVRKRFPQIPVIVVSAMAANETPERVAADAYCQKGGSVCEQLLQTMADLIRTPPLRTAPPHVEVEPVRATVDRDGNYIIRCEDCLRTFSVCGTCSTTRDEKWVTCPHCGNVIQSFIAEGRSARTRAA